MPYIGNKPATTAVQIGADQVISSTIADGAIVNSDLNSSAAIAATKIADGSVTSAEFQYINTLSSNAQTQLDAKAPLASPTFTGVVTAPDLTISGTSTTIGTVTSGIWNAGAIASTAGISGTTGTFSGDVDVKRLKVNGGWAFEDVGSGTLRIGEGQTTLQHYGNSTFAGDVTVSGRDIQTGSTDSLNLGDDSSVISIGKTNEMWVQDSTNAEASLYINHRGYAQEQTQFRNFVVSDGKGNQILNLQGEEKSATFSGEIGVTQNSGNLAIYNDGSGHGIVATGSSKNLTIQADNDLKLYADSAFMADWWVSGGENYVKFRSHATVDETLTVTGNATFSGDIIANGTISRAITGSIKLGAGTSASDPPYAFYSDSNTGMYRVANGKLGIVGVGSLVATFDGNTDTATFTGKVDVDTTQAINSLLEVQGNAYPAHAITFHHSAHSHKQGGMLGLVGPITS